MSGQTQAAIKSLVSGHLSRPVSPRYRRRASDHLLDWLGCAVAGRREAAGRILVARGANGEGARAFRLGGLGNILEMDDVDKRARLHPGPVIIPAALSLAAGRGLRGDNVLDAIVRGYEAMIRLGRAVGDKHYSLWHSTGTCGGFGAAAACASLLALDAEASAHALALALSQAAGLWQTRHEPQSMGKQLHTAHAARAGLEAAELASLGFRGPLRILEGPQGFFTAMCAEANADDVLMDYQSDWLIDEVSFKPWPACRHVHAAIDAALRLRLDTEWQNAPSIVVETYRDAIIFCDKLDPVSVIEAKFSMQHAVAITLMRGEPWLDSFSPEAINDPSVKMVRQRVRIIEAEPFASAYPARFGARIICGSRSVSQADALGDPENPVDTARLTAKAIGLMRAGGMNEKSAEALARSSTACDDEFFDRLEEVLP